MTERQESILFDKSAFQAIGGSLHSLIRERYHVITARTLLYEIAGNLREDRVFKEHTPEQRAAILASKFGGQLHEHQDWKTICTRELLGDRLLQRGPILDDSVEATDESGRKVYLRVKRPDGTVVSTGKNWIDQVSAGTWPARYPADLSTLADGVTSLRGMMAQKIDQFPVPTTISAVVSAVDRLLNDVDLQERLLVWITYGVSNQEARRDVKDLVKRRWLDLGRPRLEKFAPYACYCARVKLLYLVGYNVWPKPREINDLDDLEYLFLLPFCDVFATDDKFLREIAKHLVRPKQSIIGSIELKEVFQNDQSKA